MSRINRVILKHLIVYKWQFVWVCFLILLATGFQVITPWPFKFLIDNVLDRELLDVATLPGKFFAAFQSKETLGTAVVFLFFFSNILATIFDYVRSKTTASFVKTLIFHFSEDAFRQMEGFNYSYFRKKDIGDYVYRLSYDVSSIGEFVEQGVLPIITSSIYFLVTMIILFQIDITLTLLTMTVIPILTVSVYILNTRIEKAAERSETSNSLLFTFVQQTLLQLRIVQAFSQEPKELRRYDKKMNESLASEFSVFHLNFILTLVIGCIIAVTYSAIIGLGISSIFSGQMSTGLLIVYIFYLDNITGPILSILYATSLVKETSVRLKRLTDLFNPAYQIKDTGTLTVVDDTAIRFDHVYLKESNSEEILHDVSCTFPAGKITAFVGTSGSGKSSLIGLLMRFIDQPTSGSIFIGSHPINSYTISTLRNAMGYVPQEALLPNETIEYIIRFGNPNASSEDIRKAARMAVADEFIDTHQGDYQFRVGDGGNLLSGGQRQRLMVARAYLKNPPILILDEVFASQDPATRQRMIGLLREFAKNKTVILITNILDVLNEYDNVILIQNGRIISSGQYKDLLHDSYLANLLFESNERR